MLELRCFSDQDLRAYLLGKLPERVSRSVAAHLEGCPNCDTRARRLDGETDPLVADSPYVLRADLFQSPIHILREPLLAVVKHLTSENRRKVEQPRFWAFGCC